MRRLCLILIVSTLAACSFIQDELYSPGGRAGVTMNDKIFSARSVKQRADRHLAMMMFTANISSQFVETSEDAQSIMLQIDATGQAIAALYSISGKAEKCYEASNSVQQIVPVEGFSSVQANCPSLTGLERADAQATSGIISVLGLSFYGGNGDDLVSDVLDMDVVSLASGLIDKVPSVLRSTAGFRDSLVTFSEATYLACHEITPFSEVSENAPKEKVKTDQCADLGRMLASLSIGAKYVAIDAEGETIRAYKKGLKNIRAILKDEKYATWSFISSKGAMKQQIADACVRYKKIVEVDTGNETSIGCGKFFETTLTNYKVSGAI